MLVAVFVGANLLGGAPPRVVGYIAVSPSAAAGDALPGRFLLFCDEPLMCVVALPGCKRRGHGQFGPRLHLLPRGPAVHGDVLRVREQRDREHNWLDRHESELGGAPQQGFGSDFCISTLTVTLLKEIKKSKELLCRGAAGGCIISDQMQMLS